LIIHLPPVEDWVTLSYLGLDGGARELREAWRVVDNLPPMTDPNEVSAVAAATGVDLDSDEKSRANKVLFVPDVVRAEGGRSSAQLRRPTPSGAPIWPPPCPGCSGPAKW